MDLLPTGTSAAVTHTITHMRLQVSSIYTRVEKHKLKLKLPNKS